MSGKYLERSGGVIISVECFITAMAMYVSIGTEHDIPHRSGLPPLASNRTINVSQRWITLLTLQPAANTALLREQPGF